MDRKEHHAMWLAQVDKLRQSLADLSQTSPQNILSHFFLQAVEYECKYELDSVKTKVKDMLVAAIHAAETLDGESVRLRAVRVLNTIMTPEPLIGSLRLADIRNVAVFEIYKRCGVTIDTYFERYSSPPGSESQNQTYARIAHGNAICNARQTQMLSDILLYMQILKRFFCIYDHVTKTAVPLGGNELNWCGEMWACHIETFSLADLIWELYLDLWFIENES